jgi:hypothetical protein
VLQLNYNERTDRLQIKTITFVEDPQTMIEIPVADHRKELDRFFCAWIEILQKLLE